jgi:hypothetical protein
VWVNQIEEMVYFELTIVIQLYVQTVSPSRSGSANTALPDYLPVPARAMEGVVPVFFWVVVVSLLFMVVKVFLARASQR